MDAARIKLVEAEQKAAELFQVAQDRNLIVAGKFEKELNNEIFALAGE
jgi:hypothetical protein